MGILSADGFARRTLYHTLPRRADVRLPFAFLNSLFAMDEQPRNFRYRHLQTVRCMIGNRVGAGGTSGEQYLQGAVTRNYIFKELAGVIERHHLPILPSRLRQALPFSFTNH
ncbi:MAG: tryptophan 2,3-dioxygenase family protein [Chthoniobacterales bacterium]